MGDTPLTTGLAALSRFFVGDGDLAETLDRVAHVGVGAVGPAELCGITLLVEGPPRTAIVGDEAAPEMDQAQYGTGDGPCLQAFETMCPVEIPSTTAPGPWPEFRRAAAAPRLPSTLSLPLVVGDASVGVMNLYATAPEAFDEPARRAAMQVASQAAIVLANAQAYWDARELSTGLGEAMKHRAVIEQAKGVLIGSQGCDDEAAFALLVRASQRENVKVRDVARRIVDAAVARGPAGAHAPSRPAGDRR